MIIDGRVTREALFPGLERRAQALSFRPTLAIVQVGNRPDSTAFIRAKRAFAKRVGVNEKHIQVPENISQNELIDIIKKCNIDLSIHGIIIQLPLPIHIGRDTVIDAIDPKKDADGLTATNVKLWLEGREDCIMPATARGIKHLLNYYKIDLFGKHVTVVGRSMLVGKPIVAMCLNENATVTVGHSKTKHLAEETKNADVLVVAVGKPGLIDEKYVKKGQVVIDVGISRTQDNKLIGDVDFNSVSKKVSAITPVPGGVGPMTVFSLFENLIGLCEKW